MQLHQCLSYPRTVPKPAPPTESPISVNNATLHSLPQIKPKGLRFGHPFPPLITSKPSLCPLHTSPTILQTKHHFKLTDLITFSRASLPPFLPPCSPFSWRRQWHPTPVLLPGKSHGQGSLVGCSPWGREELDTTERLHFHCSLSCIGEGNGNPLQCSCLENPRDGGA